MSVDNNPFRRLRKMQEMAASTSEEKKEEKTEQAEHESNKTEEAASPAKKEKKNPFKKKAVAVKPEEVPVIDVDENGDPLTNDNDDVFAEVANEPESSTPVSEKPKRKRRSRKKEAEAKTESASETESEEKSEEVSKDVNEAPVEETAVEDTSKDTVPEETETEETKAEGTETDTEQTEEKPTQKKKRAKKTIDQSRAEKLLQSNPDCKFLFESEYSVDEAAGAILRSYYSDDYAQFKADIYKRISEITIDPDMTPGTIRYKLHCIDALKMELLPLKVNTRELLKGLMHKEYGVMTAYIAENSLGNNDNERKRNACRALANWESGSYSFNMLTTLTGVQMKDEFLDAVLSDLENKQKVLITYLGTLKVDSSLMPSTNGY